jgi:hypothetical protein
VAFFVCQTTTKVVTTTTTNSEKDTNGFVVVDPETIPLIVVDEIDISTSEYLSYSSCSGRRAFDDDRNHTTKCKHRHTATRNQ